jgi:hypothetical protein
MREPTKEEKAKAAARQKQIEQQDAGDKAWRDLQALYARIIADLIHIPAYQAVIAELEKRRPKVPYWNPEMKNDEMLKFTSAQQKHHDLIMAILTAKGTRK